MRLTSNGLKKGETTLMADEKETADRKQIQAFFTGEEDLPTHYVNMINIRANLDSFFLTLGTVMPTETFLDDTDELDDIDSIKAFPLFRCAMPRSVAKSFIRLMARTYESQSARIEELRDLPEKDD
jgi:hypothetical protein